MLIFNSNQRHTKKNPFSFYFPPTKVRKIINRSNCKTAGAAIKLRGLLHNPLNSKAKFIKSFI